MIVSMNDVHDVHLEYQCSLFKGKKMKKYMYIGILALACAGCSAQDPGYQKPQQDIDLTRTADVSVERIGKMLETQSKAESVTLKETVLATLENHRGLKIIQENLDVVRHELRRAKAGWGPSLDATGRAGASRQSDSTTRSYGTDSGMYGASGVGLTLTQPLWDGFATRSRVRSGEASVDSMTFRVLDNATSFALDAIIAHVDLLRRREILRLAQANVEQHLAILSSQQERLALGASSSADLSQTQGRLARARSTLVEAQASLREAEANYIRLTGKPLPGQLEDVPLPAGMFGDMEGVLQKAQADNPKMKAYLADIRAARGNKELAQSAYHPKINLEVGPNYSDRSGRGSNWESSFDVMATMRWNVFNSGADKAEVEAAESRIRQSRETAYNFVDDLSQQISDTWTRYQANIDTRQYYQEAIGYNTQTRDAYLEQFILGQRSLLDVLDAENELFNSSTQYVTADGNVIVGAYRLYALAGDLLPKLGLDGKMLYEPAAEGKAE